MTAGPVAQVPFVGRMIIGVTVIGHSYGLLLFLGARERYDPAWLAVGIFLLSLAIPAALVLRSGRTGRALSRADTCWVAVGILAVDLGMASIAPPGLGRVDLWSIGAVSLTVLAVAAYRPRADVAALALLHAGAVGLAAGAPWLPVRASAADLFVSAINAMLPAVAASTFLAEYATALRSRDEAIFRRVEVDSEQRYARTLAAETQTRLEALREELRPLLASVADGAPLPISASNADVARTLGARLRQLLVEGRSMGWLTAAVATLGPDVDVQVADGGNAARLLRASDRVALLALLRAGLGTAHSGQARRQARVVLDASDDSVACVVTFAGMPPGRLDDPVLTAALRNLGPRIQPQTEGDLLTIEVSLPRATTGDSTATRQVLSETPQPRDGTLVRSPS